MVYLREREKKKCFPNAREMFSFQLLMAELSLKRRHVLRLRGRAKSSQSRDRAGPSPALELLSELKRGYAYTTQKMA